MITILAIGSRGDVQPYIALGKALTALGETVRIATFTEFQPLAEGAGLGFYPVQGDITAVVSTVKQDSSMRANTPLATMRSFGKLRTYDVQVQGDLFDACEGAALVVYHPGCVIGHFAAQYFGVPSVLASPYPLLPTQQYASLVFYGRMHLGGVLNSLTHKVFQRMLWMTGGMPVKQFWQQRFGKNPNNFHNIFTHLDDFQTPVLIAVSPAIFPAPEDCPGHIHTTGYWFYDEDQAWQPSDELLAFLESGPAPVYAGFGSMGNPSEKEETTRTVIEAIQKSGQRGLLATGWSGMQQIDQLPDSIFMLDAAPHSWLFPRMAAVVHHGGAGTAAAGFRAGVPSVIVPHGMDQFAWGTRAYELGVGAKPIPRKQLTATRLADAIQQANQPDVVNNAAALGETIRNENGAAQAAQIIQQTRVKQGY